MVMPSPEPNKEMDELLRAYAKKRSEQTPPELHPASRKMLQETVRQTFGDAQPTRVRGLAWPWLRVVLGGGLVLILVVVLTVRRQPGVVHQTPIAASAPAPGALFKYSASRGALRNAAQQFVQVNSQAIKGNEPAQGATVLATFQMEREGRSVFVFDGDGSVYRGKVLKPPLFGQPGAVTNYYSFEVSGVNNALRTNVVFTGNVLEMPPASPQSAAAFGGGATTAVTAGSLKPNTQNANQTQQFPRITGKVKVGGGEYNIEAQPPGP